MPWTEIGMRQAQHSPAKRRTYACTVWGPGAAYFQVSHVPVPTPTTAHVLWANCNRLIHRPSLRYAYLFRLNVLLLNWRMPKLYRCPRCGYLRSPGVTERRSGPLGLHDDDDRKALLLSGDRNVKKLWNYFFFFLGGGQMGTWLNTPYFQWRESA